MSRHRARTRKLYADVYSVAPSGIFVPPAILPVQSPADLADVPISVGYQSGSHYSTILALFQKYMIAINLSFKEGMLFARMELLLDRKVPAAARFSVALIISPSKQGFRKIIDNTFMIAAMLNGNPEPEDVAQHFCALKQGATRIDLRPELYTHYYTREFPKRSHERMDTRRWGPGERIVFESYTKAAFEEAFEWIGSHGIFETGKMGSGEYESAIVSLV